MRQAFDVVVLAVLNSDILLSVFVQLQFTNLSNLPSSNTRIDSQYHITYAPPAENTLICKPRTSQYSKNRLSLEKQHSGIAIFHTMPECCFIIEIL